MLVLRGSLPLHQLCTFLNDHIDSVTLEASFSYIVSGILITWPKDRVPRPQGLTKHCINVDHSYGFVCKGETVERKSCSIVSSRKQASKKERIKQTMNAMNTIGQVIDNAACVHLTARHLLWVFFLQNTFLLSRIVRFVQASLKGPMPASFSVISTFIGPVISKYFWAFKNGLACSSWFALISQEKWWLNFP